MSRGNQREVDRQRAQKRAERNSGKAAVKNKDGNSLKTKQERDAEIMREKQRRALERKA
jgi:hypothetical protein